MEPQNIQPDSLVVQQPTTPQASASPVSQPKSTSKIGLYSLISGIVSTILLASGVTFTAIYLETPPFKSASALRVPELIAYGFILAVSMTFLLVFSIKSLKKLSYPNVSGLVGLILNLTAVTSSAINLANLIVNHIYALIRS